MEGLLKSLLAVYRLSGHRVRTLGVFFDGFQTAFGEVQGFPQRGRLLSQIRHQFVALAQVARGESAHSDDNFARCQPTALPYYPMQTGRPGEACCERRFITATAVSLPQHSAGPGSVSARHQPQDAAAQLFRAGAVPRK